VPISVFNGSGCGRPRLLFKNDSDILVIMRHVTATFSINEPSASTTKYPLSTLTTNVVPPRDDHFGDWGKFTSPTTANQGIFRFKDSTGDITLVVRHEKSFLLEVSADVEDEVIDRPDPANPAHPKAILEFYKRAFILLNNFLLRYRIRTFNYMNEPIKWFLEPAHPGGGAKFRVKIPLEIRVSWEVDGRECGPLNEAAGVSATTDASSQYVVHSYEETTLETLHAEVSALASGASLPGSVYETCLELLMHAQEIVERESEDGAEERPAAVAAALISTASACEVFVRDFVRRQGTPLHRFIVSEKETSFSVLNLLDKILPEIPRVGQALGQVNRELRNNIELLIKARNSAAHKARLSITRKYEYSEWDDDADGAVRRTRDVECPISGWMIYSEYWPSLRYGDVPGPFGSFVWDVLALIEWLRTREGFDWIKPSVEQYWNTQAARPDKTRELELIDMKIADEERAKRRGGKSA
jgi:hypothetical protein